ncbi:uncharacterized protein LOC102809007 [Saccoglossus kowalevskii]|uniref:Uncharacterized protein LOC102809007 n=1 Tax=Saccoglossus kowalevskii TaxID=10224 RepID=A0ABM0MIZ7_SACKO|nr:PREDICTED: uncharacterized protein LOC102809007 [Saccoglossus kowalevskii]
MMTDTSEMYTIVTMNDPLVTTGRISPVTVDNKYTTVTDTEYTTANEGVITTVMRSTELTESNTTTIQATTRYMTVDDNEDVVIIVSVLVSLLVVTAVILLLVSYLLIRTRRRVKEQKVNELKKADTYKDVFEGEDIPAPNGQHVPYTEAHDSLKTEKETDRSSCIVSSHSLDEHSKCSNDTCHTQSSSLSNNADREADIITTVGGMVPVNFLPDVVSGDIHDEPSKIVDGENIPLNGGHLENAQSVIDILDAVIAGFDDQTVDIDVTTL